MTTEVVKRELPVELTDAELAARGTEQADTELKIEALKDKVQGLNGEKRKLEGHRNTLAHVIDKGVEDRMVECKWVEDLDHNVKKLERLDTGEVVENVALTAEDREGSLNFDGEGGGDKPAAN